MKASPVAPQVGTTKPHTSQHLVAVLISKQRFPFKLTWFLLYTSGHLSLHVLQVPKNAKGGILVCEEELKAAFDFFDVDMKGVITASNLRKRLGAFHRSLSARV